MRSLQSSGVQNTQNKIYNIHRRTYLDAGDMKEGESFCRKCKGIGKITTEKWQLTDMCPQCLGRGIVDWVTQAVVRPPIWRGGTSGSGASGSSGSTGASGVPKILKAKNIFAKRVTNYKRRKIV